MPVTIDSVTEDLKQLEEDVRRLSSDGRQLTDDMEERADVVEQEIVAAEFIAAEETMENIGSLLGMISELNDVHMQQWQRLADDHLETLTRLSEARSPVEVIETGFDHLRRRSEHIGEGFSQAFGVITSEGRFLTDTLVEMWQPFLEMLRRDWARS
jgi:hypothetical protein